MTLPFTVPRARRRALPIAWLLAACGPAVAAQTPDSLTQQWHAGVFAGVAHHSPVGGQLGATPGRDHLFLGLEASTPLVRIGSARISYGAQLLPLVMIRGRGVPTWYDGPTNPDGTLPGSDVAYAIGVAPFGLEAAFPIAGGVRVYGATAAGALLFTRPFPVPEARRLNFTLEYGGGFLVHAGRDRWIRLGYKYHHLSNAYTAALNPGLDAHVIYAGYDWSVRLPR